MLAWILAGLALLSAPVPAADTAPPPPLTLNGEWRFRTGDDPAWAAPALDDRGWATASVPAEWEQEAPGHDGWGWYRREVALPPVLARGPLGLQLGTVGDAYEVFWNGVRLGGRGAFPPRFVEGVHPALFVVPTEALEARPGRPHEVAVRVYNAYAYGGMMGGARVGRYDVLVAQAPPRETVIGGLVSFFLAIGVYHLVFFLRRRSARENLLFAALCGLVALYGATFSPAFAGIVIPWVNPYRLGLIASLAASPIFLALTDHLFGLRARSRRRLVWAFFAACIPVAALLPLHLLARFHDFINVGVFAGLLAIVARAVLAGSMRNPHARTLLAGTAAFASCVIWDLGTEYGLLPAASVLPGVGGLFWIGFLAFAVAVGVETAGRWALAEANALTDPLTGLSRRHVFEEALRREAARLRRSGGSLAVVMIDLDHFKRINDTHGHRMGDVVLARVGRILRHSARNLDLPARLGGEEFGVLLPDTGLEGATAFAERFREHLQALTLPSAMGPVHVTASAGVAVGDDLADADQLLDAADGALYRAKSGGRDRVVAGAAGSADVRE